MGGGLSRERGGGDPSHTPWHLDSGERDGPEGGLARRDIYKQDELRQGPQGDKSSAVHADAGAPEL